MPNPSIRHGRGLRQVDPLSPLLFVIAIDPLHRILELATEIGALTKLRGKSLHLRISMYADDAALFVAPLQDDIRTLANILNSFGEVTGLKTNFQKSTVIPIKCQGIDLGSVLGGFAARRASFPIRYLGLPLSTTRLKNVEFQRVLDKMTGKLNAWTGRNVTMAGRLTLVKSVLTSQVIHLLSALRVPKEILQLIDSKRKQFLWAGNEELMGGKCKVNWIRAARSKKGEVMVSFIWENFLEP